MSDQIEMLEKAILDLGAEVYRLKHALVTMTLRQQSINQLIDGIKEMLDTKNLVTAEEIEDAAALKKIVDAKMKYSLDGEKDGAELPAHKKEDVTGH